MNLTTLNNTLMVADIIKDGYPRFRVTPSGAEGTCRYEIAWADLNTYIRGLLGELHSLGTGTVMKAPHACPNAPNLLCDEISIEPTGANSGSNGWNNAEYDYATVTARYRSAPEDDHEIIVHESIHPAMEYTTLPYRRPDDELSALTWDDADTLPVRDVEAPPKVVTLWEWEYAITRLPEDSLPANIDEHAGKVNTVAMVSHKFDLTFAIGTVLYSDVFIEDGVTWWGDRYYNITYKFLWRPPEAGEISWNLAWRGGYVHRQPIFIRGGGAFNRYQTADLTDLIFT